MNDKRNRFSKTIADRPKTDSGQLEKSRWQRLKEYRTAGQVNDQGELVNCFGDASGQAERNREQEQNQEVLTPWERARVPAVEVSSGGTRLTPELVALRNAVHQEQKDAKAAKLAPKRVFPSEATLQALYEYFCRAHSNAQDPDSFYFNSQFNATNFRNCLFASYLQGTIGVIDSEAFEAVYLCLKQNNFLAPAIRRRGEAAALVYPESPDPRLVEQQRDTIPVKRTTETILLRGDKRDSEAQAAREMPFEELQAHVRAGYKSQARR